MTLHEVGELVPLTRAPGSGAEAESGPKTLAVRVMSYLTNHVVSHVPSYWVRHAWYRRVVGLSLSSSSAVLMGCFIWILGPGQVRRDQSSIGAHSRINRSCCLDLRGPLTIGANVSISPEVMIITAEHDYDQPGFALRMRPVVIEDHVWIGARAVILPGSTVGRGAVVAAGAVVRGHVMPMSVVGGVPARRLGSRPEQSLGYVLDGPRPLFE